MMPNPQRVHPRLKNYDYATNGAYHIIICTKARQHILSRIVVGRAALCAPQVQLSSIGEVARKYIERIPIVYETVFVDRYVIMPDHIHLLLRIEENGAQGAARPTVEQVVRSLKIMIRKDIGRSVFQASCRFVNDALQKLN